MQKKITITVPDEDTISGLEELAREKGCSEEEIILDVLRRQITVLRLQRLREEMIPHAQKMGIYTDQDVFDRVS